MKIRAQSFWSVLLILCGSSCIDRINLDTGSFYYPVVVDGFISDQSGPFLFKVTTAYDIQSKSQIRIPLAVRQMVISDDHGQREVLYEASPGYYYSFYTKGIVGRVYVLRVDLLDGRSYLSKPDTLYPTGTVDNVYHTFRSDLQSNGVVNYGFDVFFNASAGAANRYQFLWKFTATYKADIACCSCYVPITNDEPLVSDEQLVRDGHFSGTKAGYVPVTGYTFMYKVYAQVSQCSLSRQTFDFWRAVRTQMDANGSLFQPITGKIPNNFIQVGGTYQSPLLGLFYATSVRSAGIFIKRSDIPDQNFIPALQLAPTTGNYIPPSRCTDEFPNSTSARPPYWVD